MRADSRRILVVAPGSLVEQWRDELFEKLGLQFHVFSAALEAATPPGNHFEDLDHLIVRLDQSACNEELQEKRPPRAFEVKSPVLGAATQHSHTATEWPGFDSSS
jgi:hypothetical protein